MEVDLESRIQRLEDLEAIKRLKHNYCFLVDAGIAGDLTQMEALLAKFTEDAWVDFSEYGIHKGKNGIELFFKEFVPPLLSYSAHLVTNSIVEVDNDKASGRWYFFVPCTFRQSKAPIWILGKYREAYEKIDGKWYFKSIEARFDFISPFDEGWVKTRMVDI